MLRGTFIGGAIGAGLRFAIVPPYNMEATDDNLAPFFLTVAVNIVAGALAGLFISLKLEDRDKNLFIGGFLGGFSTVAAVSLHTSNTSAFPELLSRILAVFQINDFVALPFDLVLLLLINYCGCYLACKIMNNFVQKPHAKNVRSLAQKLVDLPHIRLLLCAAFLIVIVVKVVKLDVVVTSPFAALALLAVLVFGGLGSALRMFILSKWNMNPTRTLLLINITSSLLIVALQFGLHSIFVGEFGGIMLSGLTVGFCGGLSSLSALAIDCVENGHTARKLSITAILCTLSTTALFIMINYHI